MSHRAEVVYMRDVSYAKVRRYHYDVIMPYGDRAEVRQTIDRILQKHLKNYSLRANAISIAVYRDYQELGGAYTVAMATFAPQGDWAKADTVKAGRYAKMQLTIEWRLP